MSFVFVVDTNKQPLDPVHPGRARLLLRQGKAAVLRRFPFTIVLKVAVEQPETQPLRIKIDPGSKTTGMAIVNDATGEVVFAAELAHRGQLIKDVLDASAKPFLKVRIVRIAHRDRSIAFDRIAQAVTDVTCVFSLVFLPPGHVSSLVHRAGRARAARVVHTVIGWQIISHAKFFIYDNFNRDIWLVVMIHVFLL